MYHLTLYAVTISGCDAVAFRATTTDTTSVETQCESDFKPSMSAGLKLTLQ